MNKVIELISRIEKLEEDQKLIIEALIYHFEKEHINSNPHFIDALMELNEAEKIE